MGSCGNINGGKTSGGGNGKLAQFDSGSSHESLAGGGDGNAQFDSGSSHESLAGPDSAGMQTGGAMGTAGVHSCPAGHAPDELALPLAPSH